MKLFTSTKRQINSICERAEVLLSHVTSNVLIYNQLFHRSSYTLLLGINT